MRNLHAIKTEYSEDTIVAIAYYQHYAYRVGVRAGTVYLHDDYYGQPWRLAPLSKQDNQNRLMWWNEKHKPQPNMSKVQMLEAFDITK